MTLNGKNGFISLHSEEKILFSGCIIALFLALTVFVFTFIDGATAAKLFSVISTHLLTGRAGGIATGIEVHLPLPAVAALSTTIDSIVVFIVYPLFVMISKKRIESNLLHKVLSETELTAKKHKKEIRRFGLIGLLLFVWFPLHMTGPLAGSILGYFLGFSHKKTLVTVITGTALAVLSWVYIFQGISSVLGKYSILLPITVIIIAISGLILYQAKRKRKKQ